MTDSLGPSEMEALLAEMEALLLTDMGALQIPTTYAGDVLGRAAAAIRQLIARVDMLTQERDLAISVITAAAAALRGAYLDAR